MGYHESWDALPNDVKDQHRALESLKEEIEAVDWYHQRVAVASDPELKSVLAHNRDEEIEHAVMTLEWLRRNMPGWDEEMRAYLFTSAPITEVEAGEEDHEDDGQDEGGPGEAGSGGLGLGSLKGER